MSSYPNLKPWQPGQSGNPNGRPKGSVSLTTLIKQALEKDNLGGKGMPPGMTVAEVLAEAMIMHAIKGNPAYMKEVMDRVDGKVPNAKPDESDVVVDELHDSDRIAREFDQGPAPQASGAEPE